MIIVGDGPTRHKLSEQFPISNDGSIVWTGMQTDPRPFVASADVVVVPSSAEAMALVPIEAMASGRSVVGFDAGGVRHTIGAAGAVLPIGDVSGLARALAYRLLNREIATDEGRTGRKRAEAHFDINRANSSFADLLEEIVTTSSSNHVQAGRRQRRPPSQAELARMLDPKLVVTPTIRLLSDLARKTPSGSRPTAPIAPSWNARSATSPAALGAAEMPAAADTPAS